MSAINMIKDQKGFFSIEIKPPCGFPSEYEGSRLANDRKRKNGVRREIFTYSKSIRKLREQKSSKKNFIFFHKLYARGYMYMVLHENNKAVDDMEECLSIIQEIEDTKAKLTKNKRIEHRRNNLRTCDYHKILCLHHLGRLHAFIDSAEKSLEYLGRALEEKPYFFDCLRFRISTRLTRSLQTLLSLEEYKTLLCSTEKFVLENSESLQGLSKGIWLDYYKFLIEIGDSFLDLGTHEKSVFYFDLAEIEYRKLKTKYVRVCGVVYVKRAELHLAMKEYDLCLQDLKKYDHQTICCPDVSPITAHVILGKYYFVQSLYREAIDVFENIVNSGQGYDISEIHTHKKHREPKTKEMSRKCECCEFKEVLDYLLACYAEMGYWEKAVSIGEKRLKALNKTLLLGFLDETDLETLLPLLRITCECYHELNDFDEGIMVFKRFSNYIEVCINGIYFSKTYKKYGEIIGFMTTIKNKHLPPKLDDEELKILKNFNKNPQKEFSIESTQGRRAMDIFVRTLIEQKFNKISKVVSLLVHLNKKVDKVLNEKKKYCRMMKSVRREIAEIEELTNKHSHFFDAKVNLNEKYRNLYIGPLFHLDDFAYSWAFELRCCLKLCVVCDSKSTKACKCKRAYYCSIEHQKEDWELHKSECCGKQEEEQAVEEEEDEKEEEKGEEEVTVRETKRKNQMRKCAVCGKKKNLKRCGKCKSNYFPYLFHNSLFDQGKTVFYCSSRHQKEDWKNHKSKCKVKN